MQKSINSAQSLRSLFDIFPKDQRSQMMSKGNIFPLALEMFNEDPNYVSRDYSTKRVESQVRQYADAMKRGDVFPAAQVKVIDGKVLIRCGVLTVRAARLAASEGYPIKRLTAVDVDGDEIVQDKAILKSDDGLSLLPLERAVIYARMMLSRGLTIEEIAKLDGCNPATVKQYINAYNLPIDLKQLINWGGISMSLAVEMFGEHGAKAIQMIKDNIDANSFSDNNSALSLPGIQEVSAKGPRFTRKSLVSITGYRSSFGHSLVKEVTDSLRQLLPNLAKAEVKNDRVTVDLTIEQYEAFIKLAAEVEPKLKNSNDCSSADLVKVA